MPENWEASLKCATFCSRCQKKLARDDKRILSVYDHQPICMECKKAEEKRPDYTEKSTQMLSCCMADKEKGWSDPEGFCFHHFYSYTCKS
jgi:hypothetical protein